MSRLRTAVHTLFAWLVGLSVAGAWWLHFGHWFDPFETPLIGAATAACLLATLASARVAVVNPAGTLEAGAVLWFACVPLVLAQIAAPDLEDAAAWSTRFSGSGLLQRVAQEELVLRVSPLESATLACLMSGAVGLSRVTWARALSVPIAWIAGAWLGFQVLGREGLVLGVVAAIALVVVASSRTRSTSFRAARVLAILAVAMVVGMAVDIHGFFIQETSFGPYPYGRLWPQTESFVHAHRVMLVRLGGCALVLGYFLARGQRGARSPSSRSGDTVALVGLVCLVGGAVHLRHLRVRLLDWQWEQANAEPRAPFPCHCHTFGVDRFGLPSIGEPLEPVDLPWPMSARIDPRYRLGFVRTHVALEGSELPTEQLEVDDRETAGAFVRRLGADPGPPPTIVFEVPD